MRHDIANVLGNVDIDSHTLSVYERHPAIVPLFITAYLYSKSSLTVCEFSSLSKDIRYRSQGVDQIF